MSKQIIHVVGGPTASGKSAHALELASIKNGVIVNADSMQIYDDLPTLTAQPSEKDKQEVPHLLYGELHPNEPSSAGNWREMVEPIIHKILLEGKVPIIVGGSGLYIRSLMEGLSPIPDIPQDVRDKAVKLHEELGNPGFYDELYRRDQVMAVRFHPYHTARLIRAWEVIEATGKSLSEWQKLPLLTPPDDWVFDVKLILPDRDILYKRCNDRFHKMIEGGAIEEVKAFDEAIENGEIRDNVALVKALGAPALRSYVQGEISLEEAVTKAQGQTRQYAKRQVTWFKHQVKKTKNVKNIEIIT